MNSWTITGNLGRDVETKAFEKGSVAKFSIAVGSGWGDKKTTQWVDVSAWGKLGENCATYLSKGKKVLVIGEMTVRPWVDKEGNNRFSVELNARDIEFLSAKGEGAPERQLTQSPKPDGGSVLDDLDIPF